MRQKFAFQKLKFSPNELDIKAPNLLPRQSSSAVIVVDFQALLRLSPDGSCGLLLLHKFGLFLEFIHNVSTTLNQLTSGLIDLFLRCLEQFGRFLKRMSYFFAGKFATLANKFPLNFL